PRHRPGTVARAYRELEAAGLVASRRRVGTVVTADTRPPDAALAEAAEAMARLAVRHGVDDGTAVDLLRGALAAARAAGHARA
ncbi:MAG: GntR family transcriptional regulator, partial [Actinomycetes bacterium]